MRKAFLGLAALLMLVVVAEFYFAASGAFGSYRPHHALGYVIFSLPLVMAAVAALGRLPRRLIGLSALVAGLTSVQVVIAKLALALGGSTGALVFGLHAVSGLAIPAVAWLILRDARTLPRPAAPAGGADLGEA
ncbi:DUF6220 domain-containing protein [Catellatospora sp. NPDC049609]|uniref:DUF6220 domain-containing protein n=1 Tax=Catellatospora sp. NPDC049609 TaxID=3155505 RepID=UPI0034164D47